MRERTVRAWDLGAFESEVSQAKARLGLEGGVRVVSCYEAGREGFSLARYLEASGIENAVVDAGSLEVKRRRRRAKTDRLDLGTLMNRLIRWHRGERGVWSVVRVPSVEEEDQRQLHRELYALKKERTRHVNRIKGLLASQGGRMKVGSDFLARLSEMRLWDGSRLPAGLRGRLEREWARVGLVEEQIRELRALRKKVLEESESESVEGVRRLRQLRGIGENGSWLLVMEFFAWRRFENRRQVGALAGLVPTPYRSGEMDQELGISKAGSRWVRSMMIELAWCWLRFQPQSELSLWFERRYGGGTRRSRRVGIVALARKLLVALWHPCS
jgi:transposase